MASSSVYSLFLILSNILLNSDSTISPSDIASANEDVLLIICERLHILVNEERELDSYYRQKFKEVTRKYKEYYSLSYI